MEEDEKVLRDLQEEPLEWDRKKARKLVWKSRWKLWSSIIYTLLVLWFCYSLYMVFVSIMYEKLTEESKLIRHAITTIETHYSGLSVEKWGANAQVKITPLLTQEATFTLYKTIGDWEEVVGTVDVRKPIFQDVSYEVNYQRKNLDEEDGTYKFIVPSSLLGDSSSQEHHDQDDLWDQLGMISDGHVAEMAFSTREPLSPEQLRQQLEGYDLKILQMPVYAGELKTFKTSHSSSEGSSYSVDHINVRPMVSFEENNKISGYYYDMTDKKALEESVNQLIPDLEWLLENGNSRQQRNNQHRLAYLKEHGVQVYGAVVTGPVRELEKLRQEAGFHEFGLGRIAVWNWSGKNTE
jgi:Sigma factor regulator C-terminal